MEPTLQHHSIRSTSVPDSWAENRIFALRECLEIEAASVRLAHAPATRPPREGEVHVVTPGPEVFAQGRDHTLHAALGSVRDELQIKSAGRALRRVRRFQSNQRGRRGLEWCP